MYSCAESFTQSPRKSPDSKLLTDQNEDFLEEACATYAAESKNATDDEKEGTLKNVITKEDNEESGSNTEADGVDVVIDDAIKQLQLPSALEQYIKIPKGCKPLGIVLDCVDDGVNGVVVKDILAGGAFEADGRIGVGDYLLSINNESFRRCTYSQIRLLLQRIQLLSTDISVCFIKHKDALSYQKSLKNSHITPLPPPYIASQISPSSPYVDIQKSLSLPKVLSSVDVRKNVDCSSSVADRCESLNLSSPAPTSLTCNVIESGVPCKNKDDSSFTRNKYVSKSLGDIKNYSYSPGSPPPSLRYHPMRNFSLAAGNVTVKTVEVFNDIKQQSLVENRYRPASAKQQLSLLSPSLSFGGDLEKSPCDFEADQCCLSVSDSSLAGPLQSPDDKDVRSSRESCCCCESISYCPKCGANVSNYSSSSVGSTSSCRLPAISGGSVDEILEREIRELNRLSKLHRLGSVDFEPYTGIGVNDVQRGDKIKTLHRFASTGVELGNEKINMTIEDQYCRRSSSTADLWGAERVVQIYRDRNSSLGISIVGGKVDLYNSITNNRVSISGIFIKDVNPDSPAGQSGEFKTGDRILEVSGVDLRSATHEKAVQVIKNAGNPVTFTVQSLTQWGMDEHESDSVPSRSHRPSAPEVLQEHKGTYRSSFDVEKYETEPIAAVDFIISQQNSKIPVSAEEKRELFRNVTLSGTAFAKNSADNGQQSNVEKDVVTEKELLIGEVADPCVITKKGRLIMRCSAGSLRRSQEEILADNEDEDEFGYTTNKVKKKYEYLKKEIKLVEVERGANGLGLSLAGHKDRSKMAVLVCGINPNGSAYKTGTIQVGDEILEVNGIVLQGRCHLNASAIIKGLAGPTFKIIMCRAENSIDDLAVKPLTHFPVTLKEEAPEEKYANFKGLKIVTMKKASCTEGHHHTVSSVLPQQQQQGPHGLGIMILEGKHAEVGKGIFISDIQEGSVAEQAGLAVGDMILSVNKDTLLGSNYDSAASLLKQTEGLVTLVVCNPNRAKEEDTAKAAANDLSVKDTKSLMPSPSKTTTNSTASATTTAAAPQTTETPEPAPDPATAPIKPGQECTIEINKDKIGLGLSIVGGCDTLLGVIIIHEVYPDGAAAKDGRLKPGDQILEVNHEDFRNITHSKALTALRQTPAKVTMVVYRDEIVANGTAGGKEEDMLDTIEVELTKKPGKGLGLSIVGRKNGNGIFISDIVSGGAAGTDGRLMKGDQILSVNGQDLRNSTQEEAAAVLKLTAGKVNIKLGRLKARPSPSTSDNESVTSDSFSCRTVLLRRGPDGFGFSIVGGYGSPHGNLPIYVKTVFQDSCKHLLHRGDQIVAVDGASLEGLTHQEAVTILKNAKDIVTLTIQS